MGAVFVANVEHLLKDLTHGRERVELPFLDSVEEPLQLFYQYFTVDAGVVPPLEA